MINFEHSEGGPIPPQYFPHKKKKKSWGKILGIIILLIVAFTIIVVGCTALLVGGDNEPGNPVTIPVPSEASTPSSGAPYPKALSEDGVWMVPVEMKPGTYRSGNNPGCYWARLKGTDGQFDNIIANGNGPNQTVTIMKTDRAFQHMNCDGWKLIPSS